MPFRLASKKRAAQWPCSAIKGAAFGDMFHDKAVRLGTDEETMARLMQELYPTFEERRTRCLSERAAIISGLDDEVERH